MTEKKNRREKKNPREAKVTFEGLVTEALPNGMFRVRLENDTIILGYISEKIRSSSAYGFFAFQQSELKD